MLFIFFTVICFLVIICYSNLFYNAKANHSVWLFFLLPFLALLASTRLTMVVESDDLIRYYGTYIKAIDYDFFPYLFYSGREPLFQAYNWFVFQAIGEVTPNVYLFFMVLPTVTFGGIALFRISPKEYRTLIVTFTFLTPTILIAETQLIRQTMAFSLLMFAITTKNAPLKWFLFLCAISIHNIIIVFSSIFFILKLFRLFIIKSNGLVLIVSLCISFVISRYVTNNFDFVVDNFVKIPMVGLKARYLLQSEFEPTNIGVALIIGSISCLMATLSFYKKSNSFKLLNIGSKITPIESFILICNSMLLIIVVFLSFKSLTQRFEIHLFGFYPFFIFYFLSSIRIKSKVFVECVLVTLFILMFIGMLVNESTFSLFSGEIVL